MKVIFVIASADLKAKGFRRMAALARKVHPQTEVCYIVPENVYYAMFNAKQNDKLYSENDIKIMVNHLAQADMVCFSSFTQYAGLIKELLVAIKKANPNVFLLWGGVHPTVSPDDAIQHADAICIGEGELAFPEFFKKYKEGGDFRSSKGFHFRVGGEIIRNGLLPLMTSQQMEEMPKPVYADNELIFRRNAGFIPMRLGDYLKYNNLSYSVIWTIGCPYKCNYCANVKFIENHKNYAKLRHPSASYIIAEVKAALAKHPHISIVGIHDDSFMALPYETMREFAELWKKEVGLPFFVGGIIPIYVTREKMQVLVWAGMNRARMGIQSGSDRVLKFFKRPANFATIKQSASNIAEFRDYMIPPAYDIILDNPMENRQDILDTLKLVYDLPRPFTLNLYSLRVTPDTELANDFAKLNIPVKSHRDGLTYLEPTLPNILLYLITVIKPPRWFFYAMLKRVKGYGENERLPIVAFIFRNIYLFKRAMEHLIIMDFSVLPGHVGWILWKLGVIRFWKTKVLKKYHIPSPASASQWET